MEEQERNEQEEKEHEIQATAARLVDATNDLKKLQEEIKSYKDQIMEYVELENINDKTWVFDNAMVELRTETVYKLDEIPSEFKVPSDIAAIDTAQKVFTNKISLSKEGKKRLKQQDPSIMKLMVKSLKKKLKVTIS